MFRELRLTFKDFYKLAHIDFKIKINAKFIMVHRNMLLHKLKKDQTLQRCCTLSYRTEEVGHASQILATAHVKACENLCGAENFLRVVPLAPSFHHASSEAFYAAILGAGVYLRKRSMGDGEGYDLDVLCSY